MNFVEWTDTATGWGDEPRAKLLQAGGVAREVHQRGGTGED